MGSGPGAQGSPGTLGAGAGLWAPPRPREVVPGSRPAGSAAAPFRRRPLRPPTPRARLSAVQRRPARDPLAPSAHTSRLDRGRRPLRAAPVLSYGSRSAHRPQPGTASLLSPSAEFRPPGDSRPSADPSAPPPARSAPCSRGSGEGGGQLGMGGSAAQRGAGGLRALLLALVAAGTPAGAYNLDPQRPVRFQGPAGSFFGYAVLEHFHDNTRW